MSRARLSRVPAFVLLAVSIGLPLLLLLDAVLGSRELDKMRAVILRDRAAGIAARLEVMAPDSVVRGEFDEILESEPALRDLQVFGAGDPGGGAAVEAIRSGRELYRTEQRGGIFRAYIPFHSGGVVRVARIDLSADAPDAVLVHARHNVLVAIITGAVLLLVSLVAIWSINRAARLERIHLEHERLAQLGSLSAVLAHEIRNPLGAIKGFAQLARERADASAAKPLDAIVRESRRLENLVNSLLLYGRPSQPSIRPAEWNQLADDLEAHAREAIGTRPVRFSMDSRLNELRTDPDLLKQALLNLIRNAVEAAPDGGTVRLSAERTIGGDVAISVEDDGPGIPEAVRAKLFSPFVTSKASGAGLGLAISKKVAESLGGSLRLSAVEPHGTKAELTLHGTDSDH
jgi:signal transduction histidine kinase